MRKEDILEKSRKSQEDEGMEYAENQGRKVGFNVFNVVFAVLILSATFLARSNQIATITALLALSMTFWTTEYYAKYNFTKRKLYFALTLIGAAGVLLSVIAYIVIILR